jgi:uncharacterized membrane protein
MFHSIWNILLKKGNDREIFACLAQVGLVIICVPVVFIYYHDIQTIPNIGWVLIVLSGIIHFFYFLFLSRSYQYGDVSQVYPIARGFGPAVVPLLGIMIFQENIDTISVLGIALIVLGIFSVYGLDLSKNLILNPITTLKKPVLIYSLSTGISISAYSIVDKIALLYIPALTYRYLIGIISAIFLTYYISNKKLMSNIVKEFNSHWPTIGMVSMLDFAAYGLVLVVLNSSPLSYVWPLRESSILLTLILGRIVFNEELNPSKLIGAVIIFIGVSFVAI